jgi:hypothetical protein
MDHLLELSNIYLWRSPKRIFRLTQASPYAKRMVMTKRKLSLIQRKKELRSLIRMVPRKLETDGKFADKEAQWQGSWFPVSERILAIRGCLPRQQSQPSL